MVLVIPAYKPREAIIAIVEELSSSFSKIIIVNDGSPQEYKNIFSSLKNISNVCVLEHARNLGKGAALKTAFNFALVENPELDGVVTADADGQHLPQDILAVARKFAELDRNKKKLVLGVRKFRGEIPLRSRFGNEITKVVFQFLVGKKLKDTQTGLRAIPRKLMLELLLLKSSRYEFELDMLMEAVRLQLPIDEITITTVYEKGNLSSHFNPVLDSARIYFVFLRFIFSSLVTVFIDWFFFVIAFHSTKALLASIVLGRTIALSVNIVGAKFFVFKSEKKISDILVRYLVLWFTLLALSYSVVRILVEYLHWNPYLARGVVDTVLFILNFSIQRNFLFSTKESE